MAVIEHPITMTTVKRYRGVLDFYFQNGQQIVRSWPKKSNLVPTPAQKVQRDNFRAIECCLKAQGPQQRAAWKVWRPRTGQNWVDYVHRVWMKPAADGALFTMWDWSDWFVNTMIGPRNRLRIEWDPLRYPDTFPFDIIFSWPPSGSARWGWHVFDYKIQRGRFRQPRWAPTIPNLGRQTPNEFDAAAGFIEFWFPRGVYGVLFAAIPSACTDNESLVTACHYAPWRPRV